MQPQSLHPHPQYCDLGALAPHVHIAKKFLTPHRSGGERRPLLAPILGCLRDIAAGMAHLHSLNVVHGWVHGAWGRSRGQGRGRGRGCVGGGAWEEAAPWGKREGEQRWGKAREQRWQGCGGGGVHAEASACCCVQCAVRARPEALKRIGLVNKKHQLR